MLSRFSLPLTILLVLISNNLINTFKNLDDLKKQFKKVENDQFSTSDVLVGKAMDFIYSNKTVMNLIARELWNVGSKAIDRIVEIKGSLSPFLVETKKIKIRDDPLPPPRDYRPSKWVTNSALDVWYGNKSMVDILSREFRDVMNKIALRPVRSTQTILNSTYKDFNELANKRLNGTVLEE